VSHSRITSRPSFENIKRVGSTLLAVLCASLILGTGFAAEPASTPGPTYSLDIPEQSLRDALQALALVSHHKLLYLSNLVRGQSAPALKGDYTLEQALHQLLSRTHLSYEITADGLVLIRAPAAATTSRSRLPQYTPSRARGSQSQVMVSSWGFWQWPRTGDWGDFRRIGFTHSTVIMPAA